MAAGTTLAVTAMLMMTNTMMVAAVAEAAALPVAVPASLPKACVHACVSVRCTQRHGVTKRRPTFCMPTGLPIKALAVPPCHCCSSHPGQEQCHPSGHRKLQKAVRRLFPAAGPSALALALRRGPSARAGAVRRGRQLVLTMAVRRQLVPTHPSGRRVGLGMPFLPEVPGRGRPSHQANAQAMQSCRNHVATKLLCRVVMA